MFNIQLYLKNTFDKAAMYKLPDTTLKQKYILNTI